MIKEILIIITSLITLLISANFFIDGGVALSHRLKIPTLLIGILVIGFGTSAPEIFVSMLASIQGQSGIALGNAYGSNIVNIGLILGFVALINPILVGRSILIVEIPILLIVSLISFYFLYDKKLDRIEAITLLSIFILYIGYTLIKSRKSFEKNTQLEPSIDKIYSLWNIIIMIIISLILLVSSAYGFVWGASHLAKSLGVSDLIIGLTIVSLGTSLPELISTVVAAAKRQHDMALGNIVGSNIFNTLVVVGFSGIITPMKNVDSTIFTRDIPVMIGFSFTLLLFSVSSKKNYRINRFEGMIFLLLYAVYLFLLLQKSRI